MSWRIRHAPLSLPVGIVTCPPRNAATIPRMVRNRLLIHSTFLLLLPLIVAYFGLGLPAALAMVLLLLLWRWAIVLSGIVAPEKGPPMVLETIAASHYVEKVRWCMDRYILCAYAYAASSHDGQVASSTGSKRHAL